MLETKTREQAKVGNKRKGQKVNDVSEKKKPKYAIIAYISV